MKKKVLLINDYAEPDGGTEVYFNTLKKELKKEGIDVYSFSISQTYEKEGRDEVYKVSKNKIIRYIWGLTINPFIYFKLKRKISEIKPDIIHLHDVDRFCASILLAVKNSKSNAKVVRTIHDYGIFCPTCWCVKKDNYEICEGGIKLRCVKHCISFPRYLIYKYLFTLKYFLYKKVIDEYISPSICLLNYLKMHNFKKVSYLPFYFSIKKIKSEKKPKNKILYVGALTEQKGIMYLVRSIPAVLKKIPSAKLTIIGRGEKEREIREYIEKNHLERSVKILGVLPQKKVIEQYQKNSIVVIPTIWLEQFNLVGFEAAQSKTPVLASNIGGIPDWLTEGKNGYFIKRADEKDIASKIIKTLNDKSLKHNIEKNYEIMKKRFSKKSHFKNLKKIYGI